MSEGRTVNGFYDPLYEYIGVDRQWCIEGQLDLVHVLNTCEFSRQLFLRQNAMGHFVFPSASHTRFAHALGACHLGFVAAERCRVFDSDSAQTVSFGEFLRRRTWYAVFVLSLLLHDIGHFALSHTIESNWALWEYLNERAGDSASSHEEATCSLILGQGVFFEAAVRRAQKLPEAVRARVEH